LTRHKATIHSDGKDIPGIVIYILTNARIIRIRITEKGFDSTDFFLKQINSINRELLTKPDGGNDSIVRIESPNGFIGLQFNDQASAIGEFFSKVEASVRQYHLAI